MRFPALTPPPHQLLHNRPSLVIGGGGAARSAIFVLHKYFKSPRIYMINRVRSEVESIITACKQHGYGDNIVYIGSLAEAELAEPVGAVVGCVPDFEPREEGEWTARKCVEVMLAKAGRSSSAGVGKLEDGEQGKAKPKGAVLEMAYHPRLHTALGGIAARNGWQVILGTEAMLYQGLEQDRLWTGVEVERMPLREVRGVLEEAVRAAGH